MKQSNSNNPDLDWSQIKETVKLLTVSITQVDSSIKDGESSVTTLTQSFTSIVDHLNSINGILNSLEPSDKKVAALAHCQQTSDTIQSSIIAFQFYDRLQQSLSHVVDSLQGLSELVESPERLYNPLEWKKFQQAIRDRFTMESEKIMFDAILQGKSIDEAIQLAVQANESDDNEIEIF